MVKMSIICIIAIPEGEERKNGAERIFEKQQPRNFPNWYNTLSDRFRSTLYPNQDKYKENHSQAYSPGPWCGMEGRTKIKEKF